MTVAVFKGSLGVGGGGGSAVVPRRTGISSRFLDREGSPSPPLPPTPRSTLTGHSATSQGYRPALSRGIIIHRPPLASPFISHSHDVPTRNERGVRATTPAPGFLRAEQRHGRQTPPMEYRRGGGGRNIDYRYFSLFRTPLLPRRYDRLSLQVARHSGDGRFSRDTSLSRPNCMHKNT